MKHRRLFIGSIVSIPIGIALIIIGNVIAPFGVVGRTEWFFIIPYTAYEKTWVYYLGLGLSTVGLITIIGGISGIIMSSILEAMARREERPVTGMVYCSYCGTGNVEDAVYCKKCGKEIS